MNKTLGIIKVVFKVVALFEHPKYVKQMTDITVNELEICAREQHLQILDQNLLNCMCNLKCVKYGVCNFVSKK